MATFSEETKPNLILRMIRILKTFYKAYLLAARSMESTEQTANRYRQKGVKIGKNTKLYDVELGRGGDDPIEIGADCTLTGCLILGHDASTNIHLNISKSICIPTVIEDRCFVGRGAVVLMGVRIGHDSIVGAGAVVTKDVPPNSVVAGNPAKIVSTTDAVVEKRRALAKTNPEYFRELPDG